MRRFTRTQLTKLRTYVAEDINYVLQWVRHPDKERYDPDGLKAAKLSELEELLATIDEIRKDL